MEKQFDSSLESAFEMDGAIHTLVIPSNLTELRKALQVRELIQQAITQSAPEDANGLCDLMRQQENRIHDYLEPMRSFDNSLLVQNTVFLAKKHGFRLGDLEKMLGVSAGYISRTAKENSGKRLSIDVVWRVAKMFNVDINALIENDMRKPTNNVEMLAQFLKKLCRQTEDNTIEWDIMGGVTYYLDERLQALNLFTENGEESIYHPEGRNPHVKFILVDDIYGCKNVDMNKELIIIPFQATSLVINTIHYDFIFVWFDSDGQARWEKVFYTGDDPFETLDTYAHNLYEAIKGQEFMVRVTPDIKGMIKNYLNADN